MKIKHFAGYGTINAAKISKDKDTLVVKVWGNHEQGLDRSDYPTDVFEWLVTQFDKTHTDRYGIQEVEFRYGDDEIINGEPTETAFYTIHFRRAA